MWTITELQGNLVEFVIGGNFPRAEVLPKASYSVAIIGRDVVIANGTNPAIVEYRLRPPVVAKVVSVNGTEVTSFATLSDLKDALDAIWVIRSDSGGGFPAEYEFVDLEGLQISVANGLAVNLKLVDGVPAASVSVADIITSIKNGTGNSRIYHIEDVIANSSSSDTDPTRANLVFSAPGPVMVNVWVTEDLDTSSKVETYVLVTDTDNLTGAP
jgi:hypothetical protein